ncbi:hypothetical protein [Williamsia sp.]|uniref:hypothetical protein n=1 Tax=Williamsia sp. TaxID=1872085 RepID=UPI001A2108E3|nr:hypothetical protein [Williamsia sp.]MBJ7289410.1 hypothetical protein [Williamsia sp.]
MIEHSGEWTFGTKLPIEYFDRAFETGLSDICEPVPFVEGPDVEFGEDTLPVAILGYAKAPTRCSPEDFAEIVDTAMRNAVEHQVSKLLWFGTDVTDDYDLYLTNPSIPTVDRGATYFATVAKVLERAYADNPHIDPLLHLGFEAAIVMGIGLNNLAVPFTTASGYPPDAVAVTDRNSASGVVVHLSPIETVTSVQTDINRRQVETSRFAAIEFDRMRVVRAT